VSEWCWKARHPGDAGTGNRDARDTGCRRGRPFGRLGASISVQLVMDLRG
jgi:hypothetical protein